MAEKIKMSQRDSALVSILERMADQIQKHGILLDEIVKRQHEFSESIKSSELHWSVQQNEVDATLKKLGESLSRYRSDMLSLVNEQDRMNKDLAELNKLTNKTVYAMENANQNITELEERVKAQDKAVTEHYSHSLKQAELFPKEMADTNRNLKNLHMDTEKSLGKMHQETQRQLEKLQQETTRRLLVLGDMESALQTLLIRTEPPEKKPFWFIRLFRKISIFFRFILSRLLAIAKPK